MRFAPALALLLALTATAGLADTSGEVEEEIARVAAHRERLRGERGQLLETAGALAQALTRSRGTGRADAELTRRLREVDRLAERLDDLERQIADRNRALRQLLRRFDEAALAEEQALEARARRDGTRTVTTALTALAAARERVAPHRQTEGFRPPLEVSLDPQDGPSELDARIAIIDGERQRIATRITEIEHEEMLLATRLRAKRQWARDLGAARREAGGEVALLDQMHERTEATLRSLVARSEGLADERRGLLLFDTRLAATRHEATLRLQALTTRQVAP